ncbi:DUF1330 domain-containing protein [Modestobacter excelsi]|uniref:DUF1330 domain-containing protein n=1 Tax=Modestobacter excelsi TaxID=2213161 RepID=UPI00110CE614|nr:DUF1330 domain-containing protein [Modestobacter excelsi]
MDVPALGVYRLREGRITRSQMYQDTAEVARFLSGAESAVPSATTLQVTRVHAQDPALFSAHAQQSLPLIAGYGCALLARSTSRPEVIEGEWPTGMVFLHSWPSKARFREFYDRQ